MYTSLVWIALTGTADATSAKAPEWQTDYSAAQKTGMEEKKPLAVVIGKGPSGWEAISREGKLDPETAEALQANYVCVYIDATTERGQKLADAFQMKSGLVISDRSGEKQAFRHEGALANGDLTAVLRRFAAPGLVVTRTETYGQPEIRNYYDPRTTAPGTGVPSYYFAPVSGGCASWGRR
jgi:hypothetical protein